MTNNIIEYIPYLYFGFWFLVGFLFIVLAIYGYNKSLASRRYYICPNCKESFRVENMESTTCKVCGCELVEKYDSEVTDKA